MQIFIRGTPYHSTRSDPLSRTLTKMNAIQPLYVEMEVLCPGSPAEQEVLCPGLSCPSGSRLFPSESGYTNVSNRVMYYIL